MIGKKVKKLCFCLLFTRSVFVQSFVHLAQLFFLNIQAENCDNANGFGSTEVLRKPLHFPEFPNENILFLQDGQEYNVLDVKKELQIGRLLGDKVRKGKHKPTKLKCAMKEVQHLCLQNYGKPTLSLHFLLNPDLL